MKRKPDDKIELPNGAMLLVVIKDGKVLHYSANLGLSHVEFVKRTTGSLPEGAWVGTVHKTQEGIIAFSSKSFYDRELPGPDWVQATCKRRSSDLVPRGKNAVAYSSFVLGGT